MNNEHRTVLLEEAADSLQLAPGDIVVDATLGGAGHARLLAQRLDSSGMLIGFDLDPEAIARAKAALADTSCKVELIQANFRDLEQELHARGIAHISNILFDLGWSSYQLDSGRGFSIEDDASLRMTYGPAAVVTAEVAINTWSETSLADIIYGFGGERYSRRIAKAIVEAREKGRITTGKQLADIVSRSVPAAYRHSKLHPATRTFQALRIAVNDELGAMDKGLRAALSMLKEGGRIAVITFHSLEDRVVKQLFAQFEKEGKGRRVNKKPLGPSLEEVRENRRARSAKLRIFEKHDKKTTQNKQIQTLDTPGLS